MAWARAERASLLACLDHATRAGQHARVIALTDGIAGPAAPGWPPRRRHPAAHRRAIEAALHLGDRLGQANALHNLGDVRWLTGDYLAAAQALKQALGILLVTSTTCSARPTCTPLPRDRTVPDR